MKWKTVKDREYLVRVATGGGEKSLGPRTAETELLLNQFQARKNRLVERESSLRDELDRCRRRNKLESVGRAPDILVRILNRLDVAGISDHFLVVGTHALYAYEQAVGVFIQEQGVLATRDVDLLWDTRRRAQFLVRMKVLDSSMIGLLRDVDNSFELDDGDRYKARNKDGFEVDLIRREAKIDDPHSLRITDHDEDFWVVQARRANDLLSASKFATMLVSTLGSMAEITTIAPSTFVTFKRWMSTLDDRDPLKRRRDSRQADVVESLIRDYDLGSRRDRGYDSSFSQ
jgi:hypothetical protein